MVSSLLCFTLVSSFVKPSNRLRTAQKSSQTTKLLHCQDLEETTSSGEHPDKGGTIPQLTTSLVKSIVGSGILALPAGVSTLGNSPDVVVPALFIIAMK
jgi:hypothetical protein